MEFRNLTPFPAMAFEALDQRDCPFQVLVLRQTYVLQDDDTLALADDQAPLVTSDEFYGELNLSSTKQESDLAPYKPHTDVLVLAHAYAPDGVPVPRFLAGIKITGKAVQQDLPLAPQGLNPLQGPSPESVAEWRQACARINDANAQPATILHKQLVVCGPRAWHKNPAWKRVGSLFLAQQWTLAEPEPIRSLPLRYEYAYGGTHKIHAQDEAAPRIKPENHLPAHAINQEEKNPALAHTVCNANPLGLGLAEQWYVQTSQCKQIAAPQIALLDDPAPVFGEPYPVRGLGAITRAWQPRLPLAGTYNQRWVNERHPYLPFDFQFDYWNCAPADQPAFEW